MASPLKGGIQLLAKIVASFVFLSGFFMINTLFRVSRIVKENADKPIIKDIFRARWVNYGMLVVLLGFTAGYFIGAVHLFTVGADAGVLFVAAVFIAAAVFGHFLVGYIQTLILRLDEQRLEIQNQDKEIESRVQQQVGDTLSQDHLLRATNIVASRLLASEVDEFDQVLHDCMGILAQCVDADRMYIWKNHFDQMGKLRCSQIYEWSGTAEPQQDKELAHDITYDETAPGWEETLSSGNSVNGMVKNLSQAEQEQLFAQGIVSILVVPVFLKGEFWGFVGFDDCENERIYTRAEESILRAASLLIATALLRKETTETLIHAQEQALAAAKAKSNFLATMSHEIRTPINAITGMSAIAQRSTDVAAIHDCLVKIDAASGQLLHVINDILDMSKIDAEKMELSEVSFNLHTLLDNVKEIIGVTIAQRQQTLTFQVDDAVPAHVVGDEFRLSQILINLMSNATKFTDKGGKIGCHIGVCAQQEDEITLQIEVSDNGIGISEEHQTRIFTPFEQAEKSTVRSYGGTGLGLVISKRIAEIMGGSITLESTVGEGSRFLVQVQLALDHTVQTKQEDQPSQQHLWHAAIRGKHILLAEDIEINREIVIALLSEDEVTVSCAENGAQAVSMMQQQPDAYDLILMDIQMPQMDGYEATLKIRQIEHLHAKEIPIIAMTANAFLEDIERCLQCGMDGHIAKPVDADMLVQTIANALF